MERVIIDAGHGGMEPGALHEGRRETDDTLRLALAVGDILKKNGVDVVFTRTEDVYVSPLERAQIANREGGDFLISLHRNSSPEPNQYSGVESLIFDRSGQKVEMAENINRALSRAGFRDLGIRERPGLVILRRTRMPAVLVEVGFINTEADNELFDRNFEGIAQAIADGILETLRGTPAENTENTVRDADVPVRNSEDPVQNADVLTQNADSMMQHTEDPAQDMDRMPERFYRVQTGAFRSRASAEDMLYRLQQQGFPAFLTYESPLFKVQVGAFRQLDNAVRMEAMLRRYGYQTFLTAQ